MLPKPIRLSKRAEFEQVFSKGRVVNLPTLRLIWSEGNGRAAVTTNRSIGSNAYRNLVRKRYREALRTIVSEIPNEIDLVVVVKDAGRHLRGTEVVANLEKALKLIER